jgi:hypothetical protein
MAKLKKSAVVDPTAKLNAQAKQFINQISVYEKKIKDLEVQLSYHIQEQLNTREFEVAKRKKIEVEKVLPIKGEIAKLNFKKDELIKKAQQ